MLRPAGGAGDDAGRWDIGVCSFGCLADVAGRPVRLSAPLPKLADGRSLAWLGALPEGTAQRPVYLPFGALGAPRRLGQRNNSSRKVSLLGLREQLATPVIGKLSGLIWVHVIHLLRRGASVTVFHGRRPPGDAAVPVSLDRGLASPPGVPSPDRSRRGGIHACR